MSIKTILRSVMAAAIALIAFNACEKQKDYGKDLPGCWELITITGFEQRPEIYMEFVSDGSFILYQRFGTNTSFSRYEGSWTLSGDQLSGKYSDGSPWGSVYKIEISDGVLFLSASSEESTYRKITQIPADIQISNL